MISIFLTIYLCILLLDKYFLDQKNSLFINIGFSMFGAFSFIGDQYFQPIHPLEYRVFLILMLASYGITAIFYKFNKNTELSFSYEKIVILLLLSIQNFNFSLLVFIALVLTEGHDRERNLFRSTHLLALLFMTTVLIIGEAIAGSVLFLLFCALALNFVFEKKIKGTIYILIAFVNCLILKNYTIGWEYYFIIGLLLIKYNKDMLPAIPEDVFKKVYRVKQVEKIILKLHYMNYGVLNFNFSRKIEFTEKPRAEIRRIRLPYYHDYNLVFIAIWLIFILFYVVGVII